MIKQNNKRFVHKKERSCSFFSTDHHGCITSQVRTFFSPFKSVWEEIDLIYVPAGTGFVCSFDKGFYPKGYRGPQTPIAWPMIHLTNSQIGIEIMFPAKYANDVFDFSREIRVNIARRSMTGMVQVKCKKCGKSMLQPINASDSVYVDPGFDFSAQHHGKKYWIGEFLCDECYERVFKCEQRTWFYQREKESAPYM